jgi:hypothetical protein
MKPLYTKVTFYKGFLIIEHQVTESNDIVACPYDRPGNMGYVITDTSYVGVSKEAHDELSKLGKGSETIGELSIFKLANGLHAFATLGGQYCLINTEYADTCRDFVVPSIDNFQLIDNISPESAVEAIDDMDQ